MATAIYVNPEDGDRANALGCGWVAQAPAQFDAEPPCVIISGDGQAFVLPDDGTLTVEDVEAALAPLLAAEQAVSVVPTLLTVQVDPEALSTAQAAISEATTVAGLRQAVHAALALLNPTTL